MPLLCRQNPRKASVWLPRTELVYWQESLQRTVRGHTRFLRFTGFRAGICNLQSLHWPGSSVVERGPEKAGVGGSIPSLATTILRMPLRLIPGAPAIPKRFALLASPRSSRAICSPAIRCKRTATVLSILASAPNPQKWPGRQQPAV